MKIVSIACGVTWVLMNALLILIIAAPLTSGSERPRGAVAYDSAAAGTASL